MKLPDHEIADRFVVRPAGGVTVELLNRLAGRDRTVVITLAGRITR